MITFLLGFSESAETSRYRAQWKRQRLKTEAVRVSPRIPEKNTELWQPIWEPLTDFSGDSPQTPSPGCLHGNCGCLPGPDQTSRVLQEPGCPARTAKVISSLHFIIYCFSQPLFILPQVCTKIHTRKHGPTCTRDWYNYMSLYHWFR